MAEDDARAAPARAGRLEPRNERGGFGFAGRALGMQLQPAVLVHITQPGETIDDIAQPLDTLESRIPAVRLVAVHVLEQLLGLAAQCLLELTRAGPRGRQVPLR